jgi:hypothetical protein
VTNLGFESAFIRVISPKGFDLPIPAMSRDDGDLGDPTLSVVKRSSNFAVKAWHSRKLCVPRRSHKWYKSSFFEKIDI